MAFSNQLWLIGGYSSEATLNDVWSSTDGINWIQQTASATFSARFDHQVAAFNNQLWLIGGYDGTTTNDVWSSIDGIEWRKGYRGTFKFP